jgi:hypothetical protein
MKHRTIPGDRSLTPYWHKSQVVKTVERLFCPCGCLVYEGPKPTFSAVSCPKCKRVTQLR